ncbi:intraflagellar transport protein 122 homolog [Trichonephila clavipes]|nr:intraflagellar transport protein 122 homolog [Trichonephila clavipes]
MCTLQSVYIAVTIRVEDDLRGLSSSKNKSYSPSSQATGFITLGFLFFVGHRRLSTVIFILSNAHSWLLDHLAPSFSVPNGNVISRVFIESSALEQVVSIHSGIATEWAGLVCSQAKSVEVYSQKVMSGVVRRKRATASALSRCLVIGPTVARISHGCLGLLIFWVKAVYFCHHTSVNVDSEMDLVVRVVAQQTLSVGWVVRDAVRKELNNGCQTKPLSFSYGCWLPVLVTVCPQVVDNGKTLQKSKTKKEILPVVEFFLEEGIDDDEAYKLLSRKPKIEQDTSMMMENNNTQYLRIEDNDPFEDDADIFTYDTATGEAGPLILNRKKLEMMSMSEVIICKWPHPLRTQYFKNVLPSVQVRKCIKCNKDTFQRLKKCLGAGFELLRATVRVSKRSYHWNERGRFSANRRITRHMGRSDAAIRRYWQERVDNSRFQRHDGSSRPRATVYREVRLIVRSAVTTPDSSDKSHFQLCPDNHRRRVWIRLLQGADLPFTTARHTSLQSEVFLGLPFLLTARPFGASLEAHLQHNGTHRRHSENCFATVAVLWSYFQQDNARPHTATC